MQDAARVLILATSHKTRGGITSVLKEHEQSRYWKTFKCRWLETHRDGNICIKIGYFLKSFLTYIFILPSYDLVHIHTSEPPSALRKIFFALYAKLWRRKIIIHSHSFSTQTTINGRFRPLYKILVSCADKVVVLSRSIKAEYCQSIVSPEKTAVIYNPCIREYYPQTYTPKNNILFAGVINDRKGYKDLIRAFSLIADKYPDWQLVMAGSGETEIARQLAEELGVADRIVFPGWIAGEAKDRCFKEASIFCLPSYAEGFPMAVLDAWSYNLPVVTTPVGGLPDVLDDGKNALVFNPGDYKKLAEELEQLINNPTLRQQIARESHQLAETKFNIDTISDEIERLYLEVLKK